MSIFFKVFITIILVYYLIKWLVKTILPHVIKQQMDKFQDQYNQQQPDFQQKKKEGSVTVENVPQKPEPSKNDDDYVDFEEIK
jgi:hypothetical protein